MEEDPASLTHLGSLETSPFVLVDYNRSGNPLVEIVTEPDMHSAEEARLFMKKLITILSYLEIFNINTCIIKADVNVNIKPYPRVEIKNVTGFKEIQRAIEYELERQKAELAEGKKGSQHTRSWDSEKGITTMLREKETEAEYGYIIDPDLTITDITPSMIKHIEKTLPELAEEKLNKFMDTHKIKEDDATIIAAEKEMAELFERVAKEIDPTLAAKWLRRELNRVLNFNKKSLKDIKLDEKNLIALLKLVEKKTITDTTAQKLLEKLIEKPFDVKAYIEKESLSAVSDTSQLEKFAKEAIKENPKAVEDFKSGNEKALHFITGQVMRKTKGQATPNEVNDILKKLLIQK
jgi:aspartyl-tRNA(Asn)/glutamyl-tRNA(Gln) amidotransferase subunit B